MRLRGKILLLLIPISVIPLLFLGAIAYLFVQTNIHKMATAQLETEMSQASGHMLSNIKTVEANVALLINDDMFKKYMTANEVARYQIIQPFMISKLRDFQKVYPEYYDMRVYTQKGVEDTRVATDLKPIQDRRAFIDSLVSSRLDRQTGFSQKTTDTSLEFLIAREIKLRATNKDTLASEIALRGYFFTAVDMSVVQSILKKAGETYGAQFFITDNKGNILFETEPTEDHDGNIVDSQSRDANHKNSKNQEVKLVRDIISSRVSHIRQYDFAGFTDSVYGGYQRLPDGFFLIGVVPSDLLDSPGLALSRYFLWILLIVVILSCLLIFAQVNRVLVNPINLLRKQITRLKEGDFSVDITLPGNDEIAELSEDFKLMSETLANSAERVNNLAYYDSLTGLPNRTTFQIQLSKSISHCQRMDTSLALLYIDLDDFKYVNDVYGHHTGDDLLKEAALRLEECLRCVDYISRQEKDQDDWNNDMVVRLGGDEFTVILNDVLQAHQASLIAQRIVKSLSSVFIIGDREITLGASVGIAMYPMDGHTAEHLIKSADLAMYEAKQKGKNNFHFFTSALDAAVTKRLEIENDLRAAIENDQFFLVYQPKVDVHTGAVKSVEALVRWQHPDKGIISPFNFIPVAEDTGQIIEIGEMVLKKACQQIKYWREKGVNTVTVAVNLSAAQLSAVDVAELIKQNLDEFEIPAHSLEVEITESLLVRDEKKSIAVLEKIKEMGVKIALDDFGTGFSSLSYLRKFPIDILKIDRSFVLEMENDFDSQMIVKAIVDLAKALSLKVVVEGVETSGQFHLVRHFKCDLIQGYYFSRPVKADDLCLNFSELATSI